MVTRAMLQAMTRRLVQRLMRRRTPVLQAMQTVQ
jgi:hypothetical protein